LKVYAFIRRIHVDSLSQIFGVALVFEASGNVLENTKRPGG
jgi:hypothetical protein